MPDGPGRFSQGFTCPAILRSHWKEDCIFIYGAVTLYGRPFQTVLLTLSYPSFNHFSQLLRTAKNDYCGPATPNSPCGSSGLAYSEFARHYCRNHGCFLFLRVLRWFTSPSLLYPPMNSAENNQCLHWLGSPIRKSPDHRLLASPRGLSQLATSFIAYLCQGIHTHALSSLTIKFTLNTEYLDKKPVARSQEPECTPNASRLTSLNCAINHHSLGGRDDFCNFVVARQYSIFKDRTEQCPVVSAQGPEKLETGYSPLLTVLFWWAWIDSNYRPHPYQGCALAT